MQPKKIAKRAIILVLILNCLSCFIFQTLSPISGSAEIILAREISDQKMTYIIAGNLGQPDEATAEIVDHITGGITLLKFSNFGYSPTRFIEQIEADMVKYPLGTQFQLVSISLGTQVAQTISNQKNAEIFAINPCMNLNFLNSGMQLACTSAGVIGGFFETAIGWAGYIPVFDPLNAPATHNYSLATLFDQYLAILFFRTEQPYYPELTKVVISQNDELLDNTFIEKFFAGSETITIPAKHGSINNFPSEYKQALDLLDLY